MGRILWLAGAGVLALVIAVVWMVPLIGGPFTIDCGPAEPAACDRAWRQVAADHPDWLPVTRVQVHEITSSGPPCGSYFIERWVFASLITYDCL